MRIASNTVSDAMLRQIQQLTTDQAKLQQQVGSGRRITDPEDDPAAVGRILNLQSEQRQQTQFASNASRALTLAQASYSGLKSLKTISDRANELATLGTGAMSPESMAAYATEMNQLIEQGLQIANGKSGNDFLYAGTAVDSTVAMPTPFVATTVAGQITAVTYGDGSAAYSTQARIPLSEATSVTPSTSGATNQGIADFINAMITLRDALNSGNTTAVSAAQPALVAGEDGIITAMADNGGIQSRIEAAQSLQADSVSSLESRISDESSVDLPTTIVKLTQTQTAYQAALASMTKVMNLSLLDYLQ